MHRLDRARRAKILQCLVEGLSIASTARLTKTAEPTISRLQTQAGVACTTFHDITAQGLHCPRIQCDEMWGFIYAKDRQKWSLAASTPDEAGTIWLWLAVCSKTRLIISWCLGDRSTETAITLLRDVKSRLRSTGHIQIATDGHHAYTEAIPKVFRKRAFHAQLIKTHSAKGWGDGEERNGDLYPRSLGLVARNLMTGLPEADQSDSDPAVTAYVERLNLSFRTNLRRYTRRTNGYSKRLENHAMAVALFVTYYNFARVHASLKETPAMAAGIVNRLYDHFDIVRFLEQYDKPPGPRGPYRKTRERLAAEAEVARKAERKKKQGKKRKRAKRNDEDSVGVDCFENMGRKLPGPRTGTRPLRRRRAGPPSHVQKRMRQKRLQQRLEGE